MFRLGIVFALLAVVASTPTQTGSTRSRAPEFAFDFYKEVAKSKPGNVVVSPYSVTSALAVLAFTANGKTFEDLAKAMHMPNDQSLFVENFFEERGVPEESAGSSTLVKANQIYIQKGLEINWLKYVIEKEFATDIEIANFTNSAATAQQINNYLADKTNNKIRDLVNADTFSANTRVFLLNAIYFKGNWEHPFKRAHTSEGTFHVSATETVPVEFMSSDRRFNITFLDDFGASALDLSYAGGAYTFTIILPNKNTNLAQLETSLRLSDLEQMYKRFRSFDVNVKIPKFKVEYEINLNDVLKKLGLESIFEEADFSNLIRTNQTLHVGDVIHKAVIDVNEEGTEAAAATGMDAIPLSLSMDFHVDRPFMYLIREVIGNNILFSGRVERPSKY